MNTGLLHENFELIKSLSKTEKRYFKLYSQFQQGDKTYLQLFDIMDAIKEYDEKKISRQFLSKNATNNFPAVKKYLFRQLVASIKSYGAYKDLDSDHTDLIETCKVLRYKGLHGQSDRLLKKLKELTLEDDAFVRHFSVLLMEYQKEMFNPGANGPANVIKILKERRDTLSIIDNYLSVGEVFTLVRLHLRKKLYCRSKKDKEELASIVAPLLKVTEADMLSRTALGMRNITLCDYYLAIGQPRKAFETSRVYLQLRKNAGSNDKLDPQTLNELLQHITISLRSGFFDGFEENLQQYKFLLDTVRNREKYYMAYEKWYNYFLIYYNHTGQFEQGAAFVKTQHEKDPQLENNFSMKSRVTAWYFVAYNHYALGQHKKALQYIQRIMNQPGDDLEEFIFAKLLMMFIHYELENFELLEYQVRSAQRFLEKKEQFYRCEKLVLDFFRSVPAAGSKKQVLEHLRTDIISLFKTWYERGFSYYFDIQSWIESRLTGKSFVNVVHSSNIAEQQKRKPTSSAGKLR